MRIIVQNAKFRALSPENRTNFAIGDCNSGKMAYLMEVYAPRPKNFIGEVSEWSKVQHWKCCVRKRTQGSNPCLSAIYLPSPALIYPQFGTFFGHLHLTLPRFFPVWGFGRDFRCYIVP